MLKQPGSEDICRYFGEDAALLRVLFARGVVVVAVVGAVPAPDAGVARITCKINNYEGSIKANCVISSIIIIVYDASISYWQCMKET